MSFDAAVSKALLQPAFDSYKLDSTRLSVSSVPLPPDCRAESTLR